MQKIASGAEERKIEVELVLQGGTIVDPSQGLHGRYDLLIRNGHIVEIAEKIETQDRMVKDLSGLTITPGLIDLHTHLREPGGEEKETIFTGSCAAVAGGYTCITALPNTNPVIDDAEKIKQVVALAQKAGLVRVLPVGAATKGSRGEEPAEIAAMVKSGAFAVTDDGRGVQNAGILREILRQCRQCGIPFLEHCEDESLAGTGQIHEGAIAKKLGVAAIPVSSETVMLARDLLLARETGAHVHIMHVSCADSVELIRMAKARGIKITAEVTPHHLLLTEAAADGFNTLAKMKPPLRTEADRIALCQALADGTIEIVATDHAPHTATEKEQDFTLAPFGVVGLETAFPLLYTYLVKAGIMELDTLVERMSCAPAKIFNLPYGTLKTGSAADLAVFDLEREMIIDKESFYSKGKNTPFHGWKVKGVPVLTMVGGKIMMQDGRICKKV